MDPGDPADIMKLKLPQLELAGLLVKTNIRNFLFTGKMDAFKALIVMVAILAPQEGSQNNFHSG